MKENLKQGFEQLRGFYRGLSPARRFSLLAVSAISIAAFVLIIAFISRDDMRPLATGMSAEEVQAVTQALKKNNIPCTVSESGDAILVPAAQLDAARLELAAAGHPRGGVGFELFDRESLGMTSFRERVNYRRALEGELARTIRSLGVVRGARVHLVLARQALFREQQKEPSASVVVNLEAGRQLDKRQLKGIRSLVAAAVEGLVAERVTVLDGQGAVLARMGRSGVGADDRIEYQQSIERRLEARVINLLEPLVGPGKVVAQVTAKVDYRHVVETAEVFDPERTVVRSEQRRQEKRTGSDIAARGVAGAQSNLPGGGPDRAEREQNGYERTDETINYEMDRKTRKIEQARGSLERLSVAVVVDGTYETESQGEKAQVVYQARSPEEMSRLTALVQKAVGFDATRGDQIEVSNIAFKTHEQLDGGPGWLEQLDLNQVIQTLALVALGLLLLLLVIRPILRGLFGRSTEILISPERRTTVVELERDLAGKAERRPGLLPPSADPQDAQAQTEVGQLEEHAADRDSGAQLRRLVGQNQQRTLQVLRGWLNEESP